MGKLDITSTLGEKAFDSAKSFLGKLIGPAIDETGLLIKDQVTLFRFKNQVNILNKAKKYCHKKKIDTRAISMKVLCPLLDNAGLEENDFLQEKWAFLLGNMVDSTQNIQNHVFPFILGQISSEEFKIAEQTLENLYKNKEIAERKKSLLNEISEAEKELYQHSSKDGNFKNPELYEQKRKVYLDLKVELNNLEKAIEYNRRLISGLQLFEMANLTRLGLIKSHTLLREHLTPQPSTWNNRANKDVNITYGPEISFLTELGELFIKACSEKK